jgi:uncharacterized membrane protein YgcG
MFISIRVLVISMLVTSLAICVCAQMSPVAQQPKVTQDVAHFVKRQGLFGGGGHNGGGDSSGSSGSNNDGSSGGSSGGSDASR